MDLDGEPEARLPIRRTIRGSFDDRDFARALTRLGLRGVDPKEGPNKDTQTTFRYKFNVLAPGNQSYGTKVDALYISVRKTRQFARFPRLDVTEEFSEQGMTEWIDRTDSESIRTAVVRRWNELREELEEA